MFDLRQLESDIFLAACADCLSLVAQMVFQYLGYWHRKKQRRESLATADSDGLKFSNPLVQLGDNDDDEVVDA